MGHPDDSDDDTPDVDPASLPGYGVGFRQGYGLGVAFAVDGFREALIESGTDAGTAYLLAEQLKRWLGKRGR